MSVKVAVRVRPFNERESGSKCCIRMVSLIACTFADWPINYYG